MTSTNGHSEPSTGGASRPRRGRLSRRQRVAVLLVFALVVSAVVFGLLEGALRLAGYGGYAPTFSRAGTLPDGATLVMTDHGGPASYFFRSRSRPASLNPTAFEMPKPAGTVRIVMAGGSAAKGSPYPRHLTSSAFLRAMLEDAWPGRHVEVINIGTTAIASFPVLGMVTESLEYDPDLVVIYAGNNEFYGAYGVASLHTAGRSPFMIRLIRATRSLAIAQFIDRHLGGGYDRHDDRTLMEAMVGRASIGPDDPARADAARNLGAFVGDAVRRCRAHGVPVIVCTPPCNERGLAPLGERDRSWMNDTDRAEIESLLADAAAGVGGDPDAVEEAARAALELDPQDATAHYLLGRALDERGEFDEASVEFRRAVDLDPMPWRPPSASVQSVREAARSHGAVLCDLAEAFRAESPGGSVGWELMDDHVHPSLRGQWLIARSIVASMSELSGELLVDADRFAALSSREDYDERLLANPYDEYAAAHAMRVLGMIPFYQRSNPGYFARFDAECRRIESESPVPVQRAIQQWLSPPSDGEQRPITGLVAQALFGQGQFEQGERLFDAARRSVVPYGTWELQYTVFMLRCRGAVHGRLSEDDLRLALETAERGRFLVESGSSTNGAGERFTGELLALAGEHREALKMFVAAGPKLSVEGRVAVDEAMVESYLALREPEKARQIVRAGLSRGGKYVEYYRQMQQRIAP